MLKRLFGRGKQPTPPPTLPVSLTRPAWDAPHTPFLDYFNLHLHGLTLEQAAATLTAKYLSPAPSSPVMLVCPQGDWITVYCAPPFIATIGFNRVASDIARQHKIWLIGYRVYENEGIDVHYFHNDQHVAGLAMGQGEIEREPESPETFADLADLSHVIPRPETQHPLDFHIALLEAVGITHASLTWGQALQRYQDGEFAGAKLLPMQVNQ